MRKFILSLSFLPLTLATLSLSIFLLQYSFDKKNAFLFNKSPYQLYAALPPDSKPIKPEVGSLNIHTEAIERFLKAHKSPLVPFADHMVTASSKYGIDPRLLPAIAMQESNLCKKVPPNSYNCWGYGIYGGRRLTFKNFEEAIETVAKSLAYNYKAKGLSTPQEIMTKYTPRNTNNWAVAVEHFMEQLTLF